MWGDYLIEFVLAFVISFIATPYTIKIAKKIGAVDIPKDERRMHKKHMPKFGGPAVIIGFVIATCYMLCSLSLDKYINLFDYNNYFKKLIGLAVGICFLSIFTIYDDIKPIKPLTKLIGQVVAALIVISCGIKINDLNISFIHNKYLLEAIYNIITLIWIVGVTNAINLIDGLDGLSTGITVIACISLLIIFVINGSPLISIVLITALLGALLGFLPFNFNPAKTFLGDTGSNFLGFAISIISILGIAKTYTFAVIVLPVVALGLPLLDTICAIFRRLKNGKSLKAIFKADKGHLHHKLVAMGLSQKQAVIILYGIAAFFGMFAVILFESGIYRAFFFLFIICIGLYFGYRNFVNDEKNDMQKFECMDCKYIYNPKYGNSKGGIKPGTKFQDLPKEWVCPVCGESKDRFEISKR